MMTPERIHSIAPRRVKGVVAALLLLVFAAAPSYGQFYFGRNKIQYEQFDWQVLSTPHFQLYYYPEEETLARAAAYWAEEAFDDLEQKFNHTLRRQVPLVIYSNHLHFQQTNTTPMLLPEGVGGFFEFLKGRVVLPYGGSMYDFWHVIRHELVHVFMHSKINAAGADAGVWDRRLPPAWFVEGLAEWWSVGWDSQAEMVIRDALLHDHLFPVENLTVAGAGFLVYKEGQSFLRFLEERYGADRIRQIMAEFYHHDSFQEVVEAVTGKEFRDLSREWRLSLKKAAARALTDNQLPGDGARTITKYGANVSPSLYVDAAGEMHVVYLSSRNGYASVYRQSLDGSPEQLVIQGERTPEMESLHFMQSGLGINAEGIMALVSKSFDRDIIRLIDLESGDIIREFSEPRLTTIRSPAWSPDGERIVFAAQDRSGQSDLYIWDLGSSDATALTSDIYLDQDPVFSPDGQEIIFSTDRGRPLVDGGLSIYRLTLADKNLTPLTEGPHKDTKPKWSPDGDGKIQFISDRSGTPNIWQLALDAEKQMTIGPVTDLHTGAIDFIPLPGDSLLITTFAEYNFQLQIADENSNLREKSTAIQLRSVPFTAWTPPRYVGPSKSDSRPYRLKYSLDIAQTALAYNPIIGVLGGLQLGISDMLGNRYYHFLAANTAQTTSEFASHFNFAVTMVNLARRVNYALGIFRFANEYYNLNENSDDAAIYFDKTTGIRSGLNYPLNIFQRVELSASLWQSDRTYFSFQTERPEKALLTAWYLSYVHDNSLWHAAGPADGWRLRVSIGSTYNLGRERFRNYLLLVDNRVYVRLNRRFTYAQRAMAWVNEGTDVRRAFIGGSWGMRGYRLNEIKGRRYVMLNQEIRFPFAQSLALRTGSFAIGFAPILGALFVDLGNAWSRDYPGLLGSAGFGLRGLFMGGLVIRMDTGKKFNFHNDERPGFIRFFFGWDF